MPREPIACMHACVQVHAERDPRVPREPIACMHACVQVHGERDPRVPREHGDAVATAVQSRGLSGAHLTYAKEGHSIRREPNVLHLWHRVETFLAVTFGLAPPDDIDESLTEGHTCTVHWDSLRLSRSSASPE